MPGGIRLFLVYALLILAGIGLSLRFVVDQAIAAPVSLVGRRGHGPARLHDLHDDPRPPAQAGGPRPGARAGQPDHPARAAARSAGSTRSRRSSSPRSASSCSAACCDPRSGPTWTSLTVGRTVAARHDPARDGTLTRHAASLVAMPRDRSDPQNLIRPVEPHRGNHVSKANRRRQRPGNQPTSRPTGAQPAGQPSPRPEPAARRPAAGPAGRGTPRSPALRHGRARPLPVRPARAATELDRRPARPPRAPAIDLQAVVHGALPDRDHRRRGASPASPSISAFVFVSASQPAFACSTHLDARADRRHPAAGATAEPRLRPARHGQQPRPVAARR